MTQPTRSDRPAKTRDEGQWALGSTSRSTAGVGVGAGVTAGVPGSANCTARSGSTLAAFTVVQSSARMPPVSPEFGFHDQ